MNELGQFVVLVFLAFLAGLVSGRLIPPLSSPEPEQISEPESPVVSQCRRVVFGRRCLLENSVMGGGDTEPWGVMRYSDMETFYFHYREDAEQFMAILEREEIPVRG